ncbi:hypothetical protein DID88_004771 [Monilinia fructigena]|uniref:aldehyde dehydrogenase (NAD(+)) n=1 Tax=Monilinia fructigena TaxID=38457 RepID=A0A395IRK1_9HELO|nr:hypothetical protein DID88_004771 [Monilinia fructigena]
MDFLTFHNTINGKLTNTTKTRHSINPSTGEPNPPVPLSTNIELDEAVAAAKKAQKACRTRKANFLAQDEFARSVAMIRQTAELTLGEEVVEETDTMVARVRYVPIGVGCGLVPWNYPLLLATGKLAPALWAGNTIIVKPSPDTPYCGLKLVELSKKFFPPGVLQSLSGGHELGPMCTAHPGIDKIAFTGSIETGKRVMESCARTLKRVTLELGGNDSCIVCEDVDIENVVPQIAQLAFINSVGSGADPTNFVGPLQNKAQLEHVQGFYDDIEKNGLKVALGGSNESIQKNDKLNKGYFALPTIIDNPPDSERIVQLEPFGPIVPVLKWAGSDEEIVDRVNGQPHRIRILRME